MTWHRHRGDTKFHLGSPNEGSRILLCKGRWPLADEDRGEVQRHANPAPEDRCLYCVGQQAVLDAARADVHLLVDQLLTPYGERAARGLPPLPNFELTWDLVGDLAKEVRRLRGELEERANELHASERELADVQVALAKPLLAHPTLNDDIAEGDYERYGTAFIEALGIAESAARRGLLSRRESERLRELAKVVPQ